MLFPGSHLTLYSIVVYKANMRLVRTNIYLRHDHQKQLKAMASKSGQGVSELIRRAIEEYLSKKR